MMYGKHFASMYTGSMYGCGADIFAVWGYIISHTVGGSVELNPKVIASTIGMTEERAVLAIEFLCQPDQKSRSKIDDGRRMIREGEFLYRVPNHESYRKITNEEERREYNRLKKREERERQKVSKNMSMTVNDISGMSAHTDTDTDTDTEEKNTSSVDDEFSVSFLKFWKEYPRKVGKKAAWSSWKRAKVANRLDKILEALKKQMASDQWNRDCGKYIPHPATWLNQGRWDDEPMEILSDDPLQKFIRGEV